MDFTDPPVSILCPDPTNPIAGDVADRDRGPLSPYSFDALRTAVRDWHHYRSHDLAILQDIRDAYPELGREWQDVFRLYSLGFSLAAIAGYWNSIHGHGIQPRPEYGETRVKQLIRRLDWLIALDTQPLLLGKASQKQDEALTQSR